MAVVGPLAVIVGGCKDFLTVENPNFVDAVDIDPTLDATTLALSAQQNFATAYGAFVVFGGIFSGELLSADVNAPGNLFSMRRVNNTMTDGNLYAPLSRGRALAERVLEKLKGTPGETSVNASRSAMFAGYSFLVMADYFCIGTVDGGPALTTVMMLDSAVAHFTRAIDLGRAIGTTEAKQLVDAALVGRARAHLQAGRKSEALASARAVSAGFTYNLIYLDDLANRTRLGNFVWHITFNIQTLSAAPPFRGLSDPRVVTIPPTVNNLRPMDGLTPITSIGKYQSYAAPIRLASKLEADYIAAEAEGTASMLTLIAQRRAANNQPAYTGPTDARSVLVEFLVQRTYEFYVEGKRMADFRRHPSETPFLQPPNTPYHKNNYLPYGDQTCWPLPFRETANNPNFRS
jgi:hypothetical protein